jgi:hypothetical protein
LILALRNYRNCLPNSTPLGKEKFKFKISEIPLEDKKTWGIIFMYENKIYEYDL